MCQDTLTHTFSFLDMRSHARLARANKYCHSVSGLPSSSRFQANWMRPGAWMKTYDLRYDTRLNFLQCAPNMRITGTLGINTNDVADHQRRQLEAMANNKQIFDGALFVGPVSCQSLGLTLCCAMHLRQVTTLCVTNCRTHAFLHKTDLRDTATDNAGPT
jgi:hypothetical protein